MLLRDVFSDVTATDKQYHTKYPRLATSIQEGLCKEGCYGLRFYSVVLSFERRILKMEGFRVKNQ